MTNTELEARRYRALRRAVVTDDQTFQNAMEAHPASDELSPDEFDAAIDAATVAAWPGETI